MIIYNRSPLFITQGQTSCFGHNTSCSYYTSSVLQYNYNYNRNNNNYFRSSYHSNSNCSCDRTKRDLSSSNNNNNNNSGASRSHNSNRRRVRFVGRRRLRASSHRNDEHGLSAQSDRGSYASQLQQSRSGG